MVPDIYRVPRETPVTGGREEREEREGERRVKWSHMVPRPIHKQMNSLRL